MEGSFINTSDNLQFEEQIIVVCNRMFEGIRLFFTKYTRSMLNSFMLHPMYVLKYFFIY